MPSLHNAISSLLLLFIMASCQAPHVVPLPQAYAHNDYVHRRPLFDALDCGFCSIEADIFLVDGKLLVAHERDEVRADRTLESLYLAPLQRIVHENGGRVYRDGPTITLMIDFKSPAEVLYPPLRAELEKYAEMLTTWHGDRVEERAITIVLTGDRPRPAEIAGEAVRYVALDGKLPDLDGDVPASLMPRVGIEWRKVLTWNGKDSMPESQRAILRDLAERSHAKGRQLRLWGGPDDANVWQQLLSNGVDLINTDDLPGLRDFLLRRQRYSQNSSKLPSGS